MRATEPQPGDHTGAIRPSGEVLVFTNADELALLCNAINESLEAVDDWEYSLRLGATRDQALALHSQMSALLKAFETPPAKSDQT